MLVTITYRERSVHNICVKNIRTLCEDHDISDLNIHWVLENIKMVLLLLDYEVDINAKDPNGYTPLHHAVKDNRKELVELLLVRNANVSTRSLYMETPLHFAVEDIEVVKLLLPALQASDIFAEDLCERTPIVLARWHGSTEIVSLLLSMYSQLNL